MEYSGVGRWEGRRSNGNRSAAVGINLRWGGQGARNGIQSSNALMQQPFIIQSEWFRMFQSIRGITSTSKNFKNSNYVWEIVPFLSESYLNQFFFTLEVTSLGFFPKVQVHGCWRPPKNSRNLDMSEPAQASPGGQVLVNEAFSFLFF